MSVAIAAAFLSGLSLGALLIGGIAWRRERFHEEVIAHLQWKLESLNAPVDYLNPEGE